MDVSRFHVVTVISNACRYRSRIRLYNEFAEHMRQSGVQLWTVEAAFGDRPFEVTERNNPFHIQLRTRCEMWIKENMQNIATARITTLHPDWDVICMIDADVRFARCQLMPTTTGVLAGQVKVADWAVETWHQLQHHDVVQLWSTSCDMGPSTQTFHQAKSFASYYQEGTLLSINGKYGYAHTGYAWAYHRRAIDKLADPALRVRKNPTIPDLSDRSDMPGLPLLNSNFACDFAILGSADFYQAWSFVNQLEPRLYQDVADQRMRKKGFNPVYIKHLLKWAEVSLRLNQDVGVVEGTIMHYWHGKKKQRQYNTRENILIDSQFNPETDIMRDHQGLWMWSPNASIKLRDDMRRYSRQRDEDSNDM